MLLVQDYLKDQQVLRSDKGPLSPLVSVILPTYARFTSGQLARAIGSVLSQSFTDFELIVVDDGSTDGTQEFIKQRQAADSRVVHVRHERNSGLPAVRVNEGIELARGPSWHSNLMMIPGGSGHWPRWWPRLSGSPGRQSWSASVWQGRSIKP